MKIRYRMEWALARGSQCVLRMWPNVWVPVAGELAGLLFWLFRVRYRVAYDNLSRALPAHNIRKILRKCYRHMGRTIASTLVLASRDKWDDFQVVAPDGFFDDAAQGSILLTGHVGNWEWLGKFLVDQGVRLAVVVRRQSNPYADRLLNAERREAGIHVIYDDEVWHMVRCLRQGYSIGILADQDFGSNTVPIRFFDRVCYSPKGLDFFAQFEVPIYYCAAVGVGSGRWQVIVQKLGVSKSRIAQDYATWLEGVIRRHPEQWLWHHRRWKARTLQKPCNSLPAYVNLKQTKKHMLES